MVKPAGILGFLIVLVVSVSACAQRNGTPATTAERDSEAKAAPVYTVKTYDPDRDAEEDLAATVKQAQRENKHIILEIGGKW